MESEFKRRLQDHFSPGIVTVVGSGLSIAEGLPGMGDITSHISSEIPGSSATIQEEWEKISHDFEEKGIEQALTDFVPSEELHTLIRGLVASFIKKEEEKAIRAAIAGKRELKFSGLLKHLNFNNNQSVVITTNYDRLIEFACELANECIDVGFDGDIIGRLNMDEARQNLLRMAPRAGRRAPGSSHRRHVRILKPHGSFDWYATDGGTVRFQGSIEQDPVIVVPGARKFEEGYSRVYSEHRHEANSAIQSAVGFLILGYGFNDPHLETYLKPRIEKGIPTLLLTHKLTPNARSIVAETTGVIAIECEESGSRIHCDGSSVFDPTPNLWDITTFIDEVLGG